MKIITLVVGMNETNSYIVFDQDTLEAIIIDPGDEYATFRRQIQKNALKTKEIILTHYHYDHICAAAALKKEFNCPVSIHKKDARGLQDPAVNRSQIRYGEAVSIVPDRILRDGDCIKAGSINLIVIHTPGHTPGGICLKSEEDNIIFTGDTLFHDDLGRTDLEGGNKNALQNTAINKISRWENSIHIYPGHGESATMEYIRKKNVPFIKITKNTS
jgi:hydroxyacylglutathione hydrolase